MASNAVFEVKRVMVIRIYTKLYIKDSFGHFRPVYGLRSQHWSKFTDP